MQMIDLEKFTAVSVLLQKYLQQMIPFNEK